jgi:16S rRNA (cytosine967-C5)-methyltransferase
MLREENESQVAGFLDRHAGFAVVPMQRAWPGGSPPAAGDVLLLTPARHGTDGFFAAVLERIP